LAQGVFHDEPCRLILHEKRVWCGSAAVHAAIVAPPVQSSASARRNYWMSACGEHRMTPRVWVLTPRSIRSVPAP
jgi:hypothetical protein